MGIKVEYPSDWVIGDEFFDNVNFYSPETLPWSEIVVLPSQNKSETLFNEIVYPNRDMELDIKTTLAGNPAHYMVYSYSDGIPTFLATLKSDKVYFPGFHSKP
jgi:hypothetical protein